MTGRTDLLRSGGADALRDRYEQLRSHVVSAPEHHGHAAGFGVFLRQGMFGWMAAWMAYREVVVDSGRPGSQEAPLLQEPVQVELTKVLAGILLNNRQKEV